MESVCLAIPYSMRFARKGMPCRSKEVYLPFHGNVAARIVVVYVSIGSCMTVCRLKGSSAVCKTIDTAPWQFLFCVSQQEGLRHSQGHTGDLALYVQMVNARVELITWYM